MLLAHYSHSLRFLLEAINAKIKMWRIGKNGTFVNVIRQFIHIVGLSLISLRRALSKPERKTYIDAVRCIQTKKPSLYQDIKGAKSRFDDFTIVHIEQTFMIHYNASSPPIAHCASRSSVLCQIVDRFDSLGSIPCLASMVHVGVRTNIDQRMWLQRRATVSFPFKISTMFIGRGNKC